LCPRLYFNEKVEVNSDTRQGAKDTVSKEDSTREEEKVVL